ncbi:MAG: bacteriohemerythrin [Sulfurisoma sp.]|nr:bacteriohemerythrin [Sulfurisoma sp.]
MARQQDAAPNTELDALREAVERETRAHEHTRITLARTEAAYSKFVPRQFLSLLRTPSIMHVELGTHVEKEMTILFSDIRDFTSLSESMTPQENFRFINSYLSEMEPVISRHDGIIDKYIGDAIMALFPKNADDALAGAIDMLAQLDVYNIGRARAGYQPVKIGIGLNTGMVMLGTVGGLNRMDSTVISDSVNLASRLEGITRDYHAPLLISEHTLYGLQDPSRYRIRFIDRILVKGKSHPQAVYEVFDSDPPEERAAKLTTLPMFEEAVACYHMRDVWRAHQVFKRCVAIAPNDRAARLYLARCDNALTSGNAEAGGRGLEIAWKDEYTVGVAEIDTQHRELLNRMGQLAEAILAEDPASAKQALGFLADYALSHFKTEEALMRLHHYPFSEEHVRQHRTFGEYFAKLRGEVESGKLHPLYLTFRVQLLLVDWLINHTTQTDRHLARFLHNLERQGSLAP